VVFPHGDEHVMGNGPPTAPLDTTAEIERFVAQGLRAVRTGGSGEVTKLVCGYMACDPHISRITLAALPSLLKVNIRSDPAGVWLENSIRFSAEHASAVADGSEAVLAKFSEALFVETLRRYIVDMPLGQKGWLAGARDPQVGKALGLLHREPARAWTIADLAASVGVSRAVLSDRFRNYVGEAPMAYLAKWRMLLGARSLSTSTATIAELAMQVGYDSEAAFNRAFKREFGVPPARYRRQARSAQAAAGGA
jgi:AraC-like DNA-binding protein